ncbi:hypothetical protein D3C84_724120 [compost metagenome]
MFATDSKSFRYGRQQISALKDVAYRNEMRNLQPYVSLDAFSCEEGINDAVPRIRRDNTNVVIAAKTLQRQRLPGGRMALAAQADVAMVE